MRNILIFGGLLLDRYISIDQWPQRGQDGYILEEENYVGGCAINMAVTTHNLIQKNREDSENDLQVHVISALGRDAVADQIRSYMREHSLSERFLFEQEGVTGSCMVFSETDGERTFLTRKGVEGAFPEEISKEILREGAVAVGLTGYYLLGPDAETILTCIEGLKGQGAYVLFDPSPLVGDIPEEFLKKVWELADIVTPNETEIEEIQFHLPGIDLYQGKVVICKDGSKGGYVFTSSETFAYESVKCEAVDTTGAGDSFSGALLYSYAHGDDIHEMVANAAKCAAITVGIQGPHGFW